MFLCLVTKLEIRLKESISRRGDMTVDIQIETLSNFGAFRVDNGLTARFCRL